MGVFVPDGHMQVLWKVKLWQLFEAAHAELSQVLGCEGSAVTGHEELSLLCLSALLAEHSRKIHNPQARSSCEASDQDKPQPCAPPSMELCFLLQLQLTSVCPAQGCHSIAADSSWSACPGWNWPWVPGTAGGVASSQAGQRGQPGKDLCQICSAAPLGWDPEDAQHYSQCSLWRPEHIWSV